MKASESLHPDWCPPGPCLCFVLRTNDITEELLMKNRYLLLKINCNHTFGYISVFLREIKKCRRYIKVIREIRSFLLFQTSMTFVTSRYLFYYKGMTIKEIYGRLLFSALPSLPWHLSCTSNNGF